MVHDERRTCRPAHAPATPTRAGSDRSASAQEFTYPGLGRLLIQAISSRDYPLIQGCILFILCVYVLINVLVDVLYAYIDPRIDYA